jgi:hypothetical protein
MIALLGQRVAQQKDSGKLSTEHPRAIWGVEDSE